MKTKILAISAFVLMFSFNASAALNMPHIKFELAKLEGSKDKKIGISKCEELMAQIDRDGEKNSAEFYTWKGIVTAKMAHYQKSLSLAKEARSLLERAVAIDEKNSDAAALNALGLMYHRVPRFISFRDDAKSEAYFKQAVATSSNLDTNWRYGEFLIETGKKDEGLKLLKTALLKSDPKKQDEQIKEKIVLELIKNNE